MTLYGIPVVETRRRALGVRRPRGGRGDRLPGGAEARLARHQPQVGRARRGAEHRDGRRTARLAVAMLRRAHELRPEARLEGFVVQPMVRRPNAFELLVGVANDPQFGR